VVVFSLVVADVLDGLPPLRSLNLVDGGEWGACYSLPPGYSLYLVWEVVTFSGVKVEVPVVFRKVEL
jgi:hypothetical protein